MPKRTAEEKIEHYKRKLSRLTDKQNKHRRVRVVYSDSSEDEANIHVNTDALEAPSVSPIMPPEPPVSDVSPAVEIMALEEPIPHDPVPEASTSQEPVLEATTPPPESTAEQSVDGTSTEAELDPDLLQALGESADDTPEFGGNIHGSLAKLWPSILKKGMTKEVKEKYFKEYLVPDNCRLLQAPKLNAEISAAVPEMVRNRDKTIMTQQQQLGFGITAVNKGLDVLLKGDDKKTAIRHLSDGCRILADLHSTFTQNRIKLVTPSLDKNILHVIHDSERDESLFGNKLSEKIKAAKAIERQGKQIKKSTNPQTSGTSQSANNNRSTNSGNWQGPPRYQSNRGGRGGWKKPASNRRPYPNTNTTPPVTKPAAATKPRAPAAQ